jgi:hypothetical protein
MANFGEGYEKKGLWFVRKGCTWTRFFLGVVFVRIGNVRVWRLGLRFFGCNLQTETVEDGDSKRAG